MVNVNHPCIYNDKYCMMDLWWYMYGGILVQWKRKKQNTLKTSIYFLGVWGRRKEYDSPNTIKTFYSCTASYRDGLIYRKSPQRPSQKFTTYSQLNNLIFSIYFLKMISQKLITKRLLKSIDVWVSFEWMTYNLSPS